MEILQNTCLISAVLAWAVAQLCKLLIELIAHHQLDWERLTGDGGMPSGHSATVTALAAAALLQAARYRGMAVAWDAANAASAHIARKLGFIPGEQYTVWERHPG